MSPITCHGFPLFPHTLRGGFWPAFVESQRSVGFLPPSGEEYNTGVVLLLTRHKAKQLRPTTSALLERVQRLEAEQAEIRATVEAERQLQVLTANVASAAQGAESVGDAIEQPAKVMRTPTRRGPRWRPRSRAKSVALSGRHLYARIEETRGRSPRV